MLLLKDKLPYLLFFACTLVYCQKNSDELKLKSGKTIDVLNQAELIFNVYYSYSDSLLLNKSLKLLEKKITLNDLHSILEAQNDLTVIPVKKNLYSLVNKLEVIDTVRLKEVIVKGYIINTLVKTSKKTTLQSFNSEVLPGVSDFDVLRALQQLPGVKSPNQTATGLYVKGGGPDQNLLLWNDIKIYHPGHLFGMISPVNPEMVDVVSFYSNSLPTHYGGRISSIIDMRSTDSISDRKNLKFGLNLLYADFYHKIVASDNKFSLKYSLRKSTNPVLSTPTYKSYSEKVFQNTSFAIYDDKNKFDFWDGSVVLDWQINSKNSLKFSNFLIKNNLDYSSNINDTIIQNQKMDIKNIGSSIRYKSILSPKIWMESNLNYSGYNFKYFRLVGDIEKNDSFIKVNNLIDTGLDIQFKYFQTTSTNYSLGYQISSNRVSHLINSNNENFGFNISKKNSSLFLNSIIFNAEIKEATYEINMGGRITSSANVPLLFEPRVNLTYKLSNNLQAIFSYEKRSQVLQQINENVAGDISLENYIWVLSDSDTLPLLISNQFNVGLLYKRNRFSIDIDFYNKKIEGITSFSEGIVFSEIGASNSIAVLSSGNSLINGIDISLQQEINRWKFWTSYSFLNAKNRINGINNGVYFESNGNIVNSFNFSTSYKISPIYITIGWFWRNGRPYSELDENNDIIAINSKKLMDFHSLDFSILYNLKVKSKYQFRAGLAVNNVYNHKIIINKEISRLYTTIEDISTPRYTLKNYYSLGFTPNLFFNFSF